MVQNMEWQKNTTCNSFVKGHAKVRITMTRTLAGNLADVNTFLLGRVLAGGLGAGAGVTLVTRVTTRVLVCRHVTSRDTRAYTQPGGLGSV